MNPAARRALHRLALAGVLVVTVGLVDVAVIVALSLTVMEIDAHVT